MYVLYMSFILVTLSPGQSKRTLYLPRYEDLLLEKSSLYIVGNRLRFGLVDPKILPES